MNHGIHANVQQFKAIFAKSGPHSEHPTMHGPKPTHSPATHHAPHSHKNHVSAGGVLSAVGKGLHEGAKLAKEAVVAATVTKPAESQLVTKGHHMGFGREGETHHFSYGD